MTGIILPFLHQAVPHEAPVNRNVQRSPAHEQPHTAFGTQKAMRPHRAQEDRYIQISLSETPLSNTRQRRYI